MQGRLCLVTGATGGIGRATAAGLLRRGAGVVVVGRDEGRTRATVDALRAHAGPGVEGLVADLSSLTAVRRLAARVRERHERLDVLVNNVGAAFRERGESREGIERTWALNHLGPFLLTNLLLEPLRAAPAGRVVTVSSSVHRRARIDFDDLEGRTRYRGWRAYGQSKLANVLFAYELARRLRETSVTSNALHPGVVATGFPRPLPVRLAKRALVGLVTLGPEAGARTSIHLACAPELDGVTGRYFVKRRAVRSAPATYDERDARRLWDASARRCGLIGTGS